MHGKNDQLLSKTVTVPSKYLADAITVAAQKGFRSDSLFSLLGTSLAELNTPGGRLPADEYNRAIEFLVENSTIPCLAIEVATYQTNSDQGLLGHGMMCANSYRQALDFWLKYQDISGPIVRLTAQEQGDSYVLSALESSLSGAALNYELENLFAALVFGLTSSAETRVAVRLHFTFEEPEYADGYQRHFGSEVLFGQPHNELWLSNSALEQRPPLSNQEAFELYDHQCDSIQSNLMFSGSLSEQIRRILAASVGTLPSEERIADSMGMSTRTLRRRLTEEGAMFREMLNEVRVNLAKEYLKQSKYSVAEIASLVGYSNVPSFHRAFKRLTKSTPASFRQQQS
jgi:AraC-like DNA-binding protein